MNKQDKHYEWIIYYGLENLSFNYPASLAKHFAII